MNDKVVRRDPSKHFDSDNAEFAAISVTLADDEDAFAPYNFAAEAEGRLVRIAVEQMRDQVEVVSVLRDSPRPLMGVLHDERFNAFATSMQKDLIAINSGLPIHVLQFLVKLFSTEIGPPVFSVSDIATQSARNILVPLENIKYPALMNWLANSVFDWIALHELMHIYNGHTGYINRLGITRMAEVRDTPLSGLSNADAQALEYDADTCATAYLLQQGLANRNRKGLFIEYCNFLGESSLTNVDEEIGEVALLFAPVYIALSLIDEAWSFEQIRDMSHPPAGLRCAFSGEILFRFAQFRGMDAQRTHMTAVRLMVKFQSVAAQLLGGVLTEPHFMKAYGEEASAYYEIIRENVRALIPKVAPYERSSEMRPWIP